MTAFLPGPTGPIDLPPEPAPIPVPDLLAEADVTILLADAERQGSALLGQLERIFDVLDVALLPELDVVARYVDAALAALSKIPARQNLSSAAAVAGGPVQPPARTGEEPTPGSADAMATASSQSCSAVVAPAAGDNSRAGGPPVLGAGSDFRLPRDVRPG